MSRRSGKTGNAGKVRDVALFFAVGFLLAVGVLFAQQVIRVDRVASQDQAPKPPAVKPTGDSQPAATPPQPEDPGEPQEPDPVPAQPDPVPAQPEGPTTDEARAAECVERGCDDLSAERFERALQEFAEAARLDPAFPQSHVGLAKAYAALDYRQRAAQEYRNAIEIDPKYHHARLALARLLSDFGKHDEALALLGDVDKTDPNDPMVWAEIAANHIRLGQPAEAIALLQEFNGTKHREPWSYAHLGWALADTGNAEAAEEAYREGLVIDPNHELSNLWLGQLLLATDRKAEAKPLLETFRLVRGLGAKERELELAIARQSADPDTDTLFKLFVRLAEVRRQLKKPRQASTAIERALQLSPRDPRLREIHAKLSQPD